MNNDWREFYDPEYVLMHHGIKGQRWGVRRFQKEGGGLTPAGQKRYGSEKVTMHNGKTSIILGGRKYQTHQEYKTANKFAKASYEKRKAEIAEKKKNSKAGFIEKNVKAAVRNADNRAQYRYELSRNRHNAGVNEVKREIAVGAAKKGAAAAVKVGAGVVAGMLTANYMNNRMKRESSGALPMKGMDNFYEYKIGKAEVAKTLGKAVVAGVAYGALKGVTDSVNAWDHLDKVRESEKANGGVDKTAQRAGKKDSRYKRALEDERKWKKGEA